MEELFLYQNPEFDDMGDEPEFWDYTPKRRNPRRKGEAAMGTTTVALIGVAAYLGWCLWAKSRSGAWSWTPWKIAGYRPSRPALAYPVASLSAPASLPYSRSGGLASNINGLEVLPQLRANPGPRYYQALPSSGEQVGVIQP